MGICVKGLLYQSELKNYNLNIHDMFYKCKRLCVLHAVLSEIRKLMLCSTDT